jgi:hypothetical protein
MLKAVIDRGAILPLEPLPADWGEGQELLVDKFEEELMTPDEIKQGFAILNEMCADNDPADEELLERVLQEADRIAKAQIRWGMD